VSYFFHCSSSCRLSLSLSISLASVLRGGCFSLALPPLYRAGVAEEAKPVVVDDALRRALDMLDPSVAVDFSDLRHQADSAVLEREIEK
jgi:hypothetical protein